MLDRPMPKFGRENNLKKNFMIGFQRSESKSASDGFNLFGLLKQKRDNKQQQWAIE